MSVSIRFVAIAFAAVALASAVGCGQPPEDDAPAGTGQEASKAMPPSPAPSGQVNNPSVVTSTELPANFPDDVPRHPEAEVVQSKATSDLGLAVTLTVRDDASEVARWYADELSSEGWQTDIRRMPDGNTVFAEKGNRSAAVLVTDSRRGAEVRMILGHR